MSHLPQDERLAEWARHMEKVQWAGAIFDADWRLQWVSPELRAFLGDVTDEEVGVGRHVVEAFVMEPWLRMIDPESQAKIFLDIAPPVLGDYKARGGDPQGILPEHFRVLLDQVEEPRVLPDIVTTSFRYVDPVSPDEPPYGVNVFLVVLRDERGERVGGLMISFMAVRPNLLTLLARGDERMYERMARLVEPAPRQAAILFCDLQQSGRLSRRLSSVSYFKLIRELWSKIDAVVAEHAGIVGKHAGDGASAYFLVEDLGSSSRAACAAIEAARRIHELSEDVFSETMGSDCLMRIAVHWGGSLYMGQLVPGSRLDVTALGDEVNETARLEDVATAGGTVASKQLLEQLTPDDAASVGIDLEKLTYTLVSDLDDVPDKVLRDAGSLAITTL
ncbi:MAG: adenylate/guanylate cyclase domain-containing protein [Actinomycetota bacterium]|nr:adenylate/guanylate cyclase domain-containing protein [Actinomycetota bacterium]